DIAIFTKQKVECVISTEKDIQEALARLYINEKDSMEKIAEAVGTSEEVEIVKQDETGSLGEDGQNSEAPVVKIVDLLLREAMKKRASDIHIEPFENKMRVRYRVDGHLKEAL